MTDTTHYFVWPGGVKGAMQPRTSVLMERGYMHVAPEYKERGLYRIQKIDKRIKIVKIDEVMPNTWHCTGENGEDVMVKVVGHNLHMYIDGRIVYNDLLRYSNTTDKIMNQLADAGVIVKGYVRYMAPPNDNL